MADPVELELRSAGSSMRARPGLTPLAVSLFVFSVVALVISMLFRVPAAGVVGTPGVLALALAVLNHRNDEFEPRLALDRTTFVEGDVADVTVLVRSRSGMGRCAVELDLPAGLRPDSSSMRAVVAVWPRLPRAITFPVKMTEWGVYSLGALTLRTTDALGLVSRDYRFSIHGQLRVSLREEHLREPLAPDRYRQIVGGHLSAQRGEGIELADVREYRTGDPLKAINWRISNRRNEPWVTVRHPDLSTTLVIVVDGFGVDGASGRAQARVAENIARTHLAIHDRVGLLIVGRKQRWVEPQLGSRHLHRIVDTLLDTTVRDGGNDGTIDPLRVIPADAIVVAVTALEDQRILPVLASIRSRGRTLSVIEPSIPADQLVSIYGDGTTVDSARRLHELRREVRRRTLRDRGLVVAPWRHDEPMAVAVGALIRHGRRQKVRA